MKTIQIKEYGGYFIKMKSFFILLVLVSLFRVNESYAQTPSPYKLPDTYSFDYQVTQVISKKKNVSDSSVLHFFYTKNGDYAASRISGKVNRNGNLFIVLTGDGMSIIFDEHNKNITIVSVRKLASDLSGLTKWIRMDSLLAHMRSKPDGKDFHSMKTGNNKQIGSYTSEEYNIAGNKGHHGSVWLAKVDFNTQGDYILGALGGNFLKMMSGRLANHPLAQALTQPKTLVTAIDIQDSTGGHAMEMHTLTIDPVSTTMSTKGYVVNDYSNMTLPEIFQAEMKKRNN
jgi:hypothetical protein